MTNPVADPDERGEILGYAEAVAELDAILERLEHDEPDVDLIATDVARAGDLVRHCRERIATARIKVEEVAAGLVPDGPQPSTDDGDP